MFRFLVSAFLAMVTIALFAAYMAHWGQYQVTPHLNALLFHLTVYGFVGLPIIFFLFSYLIFPKSYY